MRVFAVPRSMARSRERILVKPVEQGSVPRKGANIPGNPGLATSEGGRSRASLSPPAPALIRFRSRCPGPPSAPSARRSPPPGPPGGTGASRAGDRRTLPAHRHRRRGAGQLGLQGRARPDGQGALRQDPARPAGARPGPGGALPLRGAGGLPPLPPPHHRGLRLRRAGGERGALPGHGVPPRREPGRRAAARGADARIPRRGHRRPAAGRARRRPTRRASSTAT